MTHKIMVAAVVILLLVAIPFCIADVDSETTTDSVVAGEVHVYYVDSEEAKIQHVWAFDLFQALEQAKDGLGLTIEYAEGAELWNKDEGGYYNPNENYGTISSISVNGETLTDYTVYVYNDYLGTWVEAQDALGWYRPFEDYANTVTFSLEEEKSISAGAANLAIVNGGDVEAITDIQPLTAVDRTDIFEYTFLLKDEVGVVDVPEGTSVIILYHGQYYPVELTVDMLREGVEIYGYGSDAYLALMDAVGTDGKGTENLQGQTDVFILNKGPESSYYTYYSWMDTLLGAGTEYTELPGGLTEYKYWASYTSSGDYLEYTLGYYSTIDGAPNEGRGFQIIYVDEIYEPTEE